MGGGVDGWKHRGGKKNLNSSLPIKVCVHHPHLGVPLSEDGKALCYHYTNYPFSEESASRLRSLLLLKP